MLGVNYTRCGLLSLAGAALFSLIVLQSTPSGAHHDSTHSMAAMSIDMSHAATPGNDAFSFGTRESCARIDENNVQDTTGPFAVNPEDGVDQQFIDVTADDITAFDNNGTPGDPGDDTGGIIADVYDLVYSSGNVLVAARDITNPPGKLDANASSSLFDGSDPLPDSDGTWSHSVLDTGSGTPESGDGVLTRITLESSSGAATGAYALTLSNNAHLDASGTAYIPHVTNNATISINADCLGTSSIIVDSTADTNTSDSVVTLREAILLQIGGTGGDGSTSGLGRALSGGEADNISGSPGAASADAITFDAGVFPSGTPATVTLVSQLPTMTVGSDTIDGIGAGVIVQGVEARTFACIRVDSSGNTIRNLQFTDCDSGVWLADAASDNNTIGPGNTFFDNLNGVNLSTGAGGNTISGNKIGTNQAGTAIPPEGGNTRGIYMAGPNNIVGGSAPAEANIISGNTADGIRIESATATGNQVRGNYIGTDAAGTGDLGNTSYGVRILGSATGNTIGGSTATDRNIISANTIGVYITGSGVNGNTVSANYIGLNVSGGAALANDFGVAIDGGAQGNTVGGSTAGERNVISGNTNEGVNIGGAGTSSNAVKGNYIGTDPAGTADRGNGSYGVHVTNAPANTIGGTAVAERNIISGNTSVGVFITGDGADGNTVLNNYVGLNAAGTSALANSPGVVINSSADNNDIGGTTSAARNVISGNGSQGVAIGGSGTTGNLVRGNYIGLNAAGNATIPNPSNGVQIDTGASGNTVGGETAGERNVISGGGSSGVHIAGSGTNSNSVKGNYIGTDAVGSADLGNSSYGVVITGSASGNTIGGTSTGARNVISGNTSAGVAVEGSATGNQIQGNYIGTNVGGDAALGNSGAGVIISSANGNTVGGTSAGAGNVISGNSAGLSGDGIYIVNSTSGNTVQGNFIGTNAAGTTWIPNSDSGVLLDGATNNTIGGTVAGARNIISGNDGAGMHLINSATGNVVQGNYIGPDVTGTLGLVNVSNGITLAATSNSNTIGGTVVGARNVISSNGGVGIGIASTGNTVQGNYIGTQADGVSPRPNELSGISISGSGNTIGGTTAASANVIAFNDSRGVLVSGAAATANTIRRNSIHANDLLGIDNVSGGNTELPPPVITAIDPDAGTISGTTCSGCTVEVFSDGVDEGLVFEGVAGTVGTSWSLTTTLDGPQLTATATDGSGNTSEFSSPVPLIELGAGSGETAPDTGGGTFGTNFDLAVNNSGQAVFRNTVNGGAASEGIFAFFAGSPVESVAVQGQSTPIGGQYQVFGPPVNNNSGTIVSRATVTGGSGTEGLFAFFAGSPTELLAAQGGSAPLGGTFSTFANPSVNNVNQVASVATLGGGQQGLYAFFAGSPTPDQRLALQGESAPSPGGTYATFGDPSINDLGYVVSRATLSGGPQEGLYAFFAGSPTQLVAKRGDPVPGGSGTLNTFGNPSINTSGTSGRVAVRATITGGSASQGIFAFFAGSPQTLALQGQTAPGAQGATFVTFGDPVINDLGQAVVKATLTGGQSGAPTEGIFAFFAGSPSQDLVLKGDPAAEGGTYLEFLHIAYNDVAQIVFVANVSGGPGSQGVFFASLDLDRDGRVDFQDNCPTVFNTDQNNNDGDARGNACDPDDDNDTICDPGQSDPACTGLDNCIFVANADQSDADSDAVGDACDVSDTDGDKFSDRTEHRVGTSRTLKCGTNSWPADLNNDGFSDITDVAAVGGSFGKAVPPAPARHNVAPDPPDGFVDITDIARVGSHFGKSCSNP